MIYETGRPHSYNPVRGPIKTAKGAEHDIIQNI